jgi:hypothetical protein
MFHATRRYCATGVLAVLTLSAALAASLPACDAGQMGGDDLDTIDYQVFTYAKDQTAAPYDPFSTPGHGARTFNKVYRPVRNRFEAHYENTNYQVTASVINTDSNPFVLTKDGSGYATCVNLTGNPSRFVSHVTCLTSRP